MHRLLPDPSRWTIGWLVVGVLAPVLTVVWLLGAGEQAGLPDADSGIHDLAPDVQYFPVTQEIAVKWACVALSDSQLEQPSAPLQVWLQHPIERYAVMDAITGSSYALAEASRISQQFAAADGQGPPTSVDGP